MESNLEYKIYFSTLFCLFYTFKLFISIFSDLFGCFLVVISFRTVERGGKMWYAVHIMFGLENWLRT
jgi:hypothetical protein